LGLASGVDVSSFRSFGRALRSAQLMLESGLDRNMRAGREVVAAAARANAAWSSTIPATIKATADGVVAGGPGAGFAAAMEDGSKEGSATNNRHPVHAAVGSPEYEDPKRWVDQPTRPFLGPAVVESAGAIQALAGAALDEAVLEACYGGEV
jgi:hypothetical protein